jgi:RNA polymerase sigma-70 factor, ECF subfamily
MTLRSGSCGSTPWRGVAVSEDEQRQTIELPEAEAIQRAQLDDASGFEQLDRQHCRRVEAICYRRVQSSSEAEDLPQEALLRAFRKIGTSRGASAFSTWLHRLTVNAILMHLRKKNLRSVSLDEGTKQVPETCGLRNKAGNPGPWLTGFVDGVNLERAVAQLTRTCRAVFVLHNIRRFMHRETAAIMNCSVGTSKVRLHRARTQLRDLLRGSLPSFPKTSEGPSEGEPCSSAY